MSYHGLNIAEITSGFGIKQSYSVTRESDTCIVITYLGQAAEISIQARHNNTEAYLAESAHNLLYRKQTIMTDL